MCLYAVITQWLNGSTEFDEIFTPGAKSPADSTYGVRIDVTDPLNQTIFKQNTMTQIIFHRRYE
mgnify:CR=1 FL=1